MIYEGRRLFVIPGTSTEHTDSVDDRQIFADALYVFTERFGAVDWVSNESGDLYGRLPFVCVALYHEHDGKQAINFVREALKDFIARRADAELYVANGWAKNSFWRPSMTAPKVAEVRSRVARARALLDGLLGLDSLADLSEGDVKAAHEAREKRST